MVELKHEAYGQVRNSINILIFPMWDRFSLFREKLTIKTVSGLTSRTAKEADAKRLLEMNRGHWAIENRCHYVIDWNYNEDRDRIRTGYGPENVTRLRRFAIGVISCVSDKTHSIAEQMRRLQRNVRLVFDYLRMTKNSAKTIPIQTQMT